MTWQLGFASQKGVWICQRPRAAKPKAAGLLFNQGRLQEGTPKELVVKQLAEARCERCLLLVGMSQYERGILPSRCCNTCGVPSKLLELMWVPL